MARRIDCNEDGKFNVMLEGYFIPPEDEYEHASVYLNYNQVTSLIERLQALRQQVYIHDVSVCPDVFNAKLKHYVYQISPGMIGKFSMIQFDILKMKEIANPDEELVKFTGREKRFLIKSIERGASAFGEVMIMEIQEI